MNLSIPTTQLIQRIVNVFETGTPDGDYGAIAIYNDGPHDLPQITYGRSQVTEYGNLRSLIDRYVQTAGLYSNALRPYIDAIGARSLVRDKPFLETLRKAGRLDPIMRTLQDRVFEERYFAPAMQWAQQQRLTLALSALVIYDSYIHSGGILWSIRSPFPQSPPLLGGDECQWTTAYVRARHTFLAKHPRVAVRKTIYRTHCLQREIDRANWDLTHRPIDANGVPVRA